MRAGQDVDQHRVDAEFRLVQPVDGHIRGGVAKVPAALVAADHRAVDPVPVAEHGRRIARSSLAESGANGGGGDFLFPRRHKIGNGDPEPVAVAEVPEGIGVAGPFRAEMEIRAHHDMGDADTVDENPGGELFGGERGEGGGEGQLVQDVDADLFQPMRAGIRAGQAEGGGVGGEQLAGMRFEGHHAKRGVQAQGFGAGEVDHGAVADMHAIEVADGDGGAAVGSGNILVVAHDPHGRRGIAGTGAVQEDAGGERGLCPRRVPRLPQDICKTKETGGAARQSNLREGASTVASPIRTFLPSTRQRQSSWTRRLAWSIPMTSTSARTVSPGRTGARNFSVWPM